MKRDIKRVEDSYRNNKFKMIFGPMIKIVEVVFDLLIPLFMKSIIDLNQYGNPEDIPNSLSSGLARFIRLFGTWIQDNPKLNDAVIGGVIILVMSIVGFGITMIAQYVAAVAAVSVASEVRIALYSKILRLSKKEKEKLGNAYIQSALNNDIYQVQRGVLIFNRLIARAPLIISGSIIFCYILDWKIGLAFTFIVPIIIFSSIFILRKSEKNYVSIQKDLDDISNKTSDNIEGVRVVKAFDASEYEINKFQDANERYKNESITVQKNNAFVNPIAFEATSLVTIIVFFVMMAALFNSSDSVKVVLTSTLIAAMAYLAQIFFATVQLAGILIDLTKAKVSSKRINKIFFAKESIKNSFDAWVKEIDIGEEFIKFNNVSFTFSSKDENFVLNDISFAINKGETIGIIGGTGSGKSTIINLIERFYDPTKGEILYKGLDIKSYDLQALRSNIGLVNQKSFLFNGSIKENLLMANPSASDEEIKNVLQIAQADSFVYAFKDNINHQIKEGGTNISGGQRQRLCIARALIKNPELLVLDDSMSALDLLTDKKIRTAIHEMKNMTKIIVSQRVSSISDCDKILVIEEGKLVGIGTHNELMKKCEIYKEIAISQANQE